MFLQKVPNQPKEGFGKAAWLPTPRNAHASGNGCFPGASILIYLLDQHKFLWLGKGHAAPSGPCRASASLPPATWVRHGVGNHGKDIHWQLGRVIGNSSMLSSARGPRWASGAPDWHEGCGHPHSTKGISVHPTILPAGCLPALAWPRRDPQIQCASVNAKNNKKCNDVSFFKTIHTALLLSQEGGVKGAGKKTLTGTVDCKFLTACTLQCNCSQGATERTCLFLLQQSGPSPSNSPACPASSCPLHSQSSLWNFFT